MSQSTSKSISNYESHESNGGIKKTIATNSDCGISTAVDQTENKLKVKTGSADGNDAERIGNVVE